ncbi:tRNA-dependent cyclodipeptide synthase [Streptomyces sp. NPDC058964]|uniref:tRNA-dependent cyclodipeptide synthase n=1 Tax=Streptomyces sp. NPDC058964 TaxID=3346681 RepID=UPI0036B144DB
MPSRREVVHGGGAHAVIGVPPGNGHFSARRVRELARWALEASGCPPEPAARR